jgi:hypothetical protein
VNHPYRATPPPARYVIGPLSVANKMVLMSIGSVLTLFGVWLGHWMHKAATPPNLIIEVSAAERPVCVCPDPPPTFMPSVRLDVQFPRLNLSDRICRPLPMLRPFDASPEDPRPFTNAFDAATYSNDLR